MTMICKSCGTAGDTKTVTRGSIFIEIVLWLCFLLPGLIYSIWRLTSKYEACPMCGSPSMVPVSSPIGLSLAAQVGYVEPVITPSGASVRLGRMVGRMFAKK